MGIFFQSYFSFSFFLDDCTNKNIPNNKKLGYSADVECGECDQFYQTEYLFSKSVEIRVFAIKQILLSFDLIHFMKHGFL